MALSRQVIISDGTTKQYPITFADGYLSRDEVKVYEEFDDDTPNSDIPFIFINDNLIELSRVPISGNKIVIERDVEANARMVNFIPQYIKSSDLNTMYKHLLYLIQSVLDGRFEEGIIKDLDMGFNRIYNLGAPEQDNDAVRLIDIKTYTDLAQSLNQQNAAHEAAAKVSETNAKASETAAKASQNAAAASAQSAANTANGFDAHAADKQQDFDDNYTSKLNSFNSNAANKQAQVDASVETARKWAIGTISEQPNGSAKYWAEQAKTATAGALNESSITNCLTEIPQNIRLELVGGMLTLKAGSKLYVPNGLESDGVTPKFDEVVISSDLTKNTDIGGIVFINSAGTSLYTNTLNKAYSGPDNPGAAGIWFDTENNLIKNSSDGQSWTGQYSLPIAIVTSSNGAISSIDQVFNGFGYIGSTIYALPGVKGLIPNGRNADGSLMSINSSNATVHMYTSTSAFNGVIGMNASGEITCYTNLVYDSDGNYNYQNGARYDRLHAGTVVFDTGGKITSFTPKTVFHAADRNEVVHKTGDEVIGGVKKFTGGVDLPGENTYIKQENRDKEGGEIKFEVHDSYKSTIGNYITFDVYENTIRLFNEGGSVGLSIPFKVDFHNMCAYSLPSTLRNSVVTTTSINKSANGHVKLGNGIIIQWGIITVSTTNEYKSVITFPIPFSNTNYSLNISQYTTKNKGNWTSFALLMYGNKTTTSVTTQSEKTDRLQWIAIGY